MDKKYFALIMSLIRHHLDMIAHGGDCEWLEYHTERTQEALDMLEREMRTDEPLRLDLAKIIE